MLVFGRQSLLWLRGVSRTGSFWSAGLAMLWFFSWNTFPIGVSPRMDILNCVMAAISVMALLTNPRVRLRDLAIVVLMHVAFAVNILVLSPAVSGDLLAIYYCQFAVLGGLGFLLARTVSDARLLLFWFCLFSVLTMLLTVRSLVATSGGADLIKYYMSLSYHLLYMALGFPLVAKLYHRHALLILSSLAGLVVLGILGTRGAVLSYVTVLALSHFLSLRNARFKAKVVVAISGLMCLCIAEYADAPSYLQRLELPGIQSRSALMLASGQVFSDSSRSKFYGTVWNSIVQHPRGLGIAADRDILVQNGLDDSGQSYAHNIALELWIHFGLVIGSIILLWLLRLIYASIFHCKDVYWQTMSLLCVGIWFLPRLVSGTYLVSQSLVFVGIVMGSAASGKSAGWNKRGSDTMSLRANHMSEVVEG